MPATFHGVDPETNIGLTVISGQWTWEEYQVASDELAAAAAQIDGPMYLITDMTEANGVPPNAMSNARYLLRKKPKNVVLSVIVGVHPFIRVMANMFFKIYKLQSGEMTLVESVQDAYDLVETHRASSAQAGA